MHLIINREKFLKNIKLLSSVVKENKIKPILSNIKASVVDENLRLVATDGENVLVVLLPINEVIEAGSFCFSHTVVEDFIKELSDVNIKLELRDNLLIIEGRDASSEFSVMDYQDYPKLSEDFYIKDVKGLEIESDEFSNILDRVSVSVNQDSSDLSISNINVIKKAEVLSFTSTDSFRLTHLKKIIQNDYRDFNICVDIFSILTLNKILKSLSEEKIKLCIDEGKIYFKTDRVFLSSKLSDISYPNVEALIRMKDYSKRLTMSCKEIINLLKRNMVFTKSNNYSKYGAEFNFENGYLNLVGINDIAKISENKNIDYEGDGLLISLNVKYLLDYLQFLDREKNVITEMNNSKGAIRMQEQGNEDFICILMPIASN